MDNNCKVCGIEQDLEVKLVQSGGCGCEYYFCALCSGLAYELDCQFDYDCQPCLEAFNHETLNPCLYILTNGEWVPIGDSTEDSDSESD